MESCSFLVSFGIDLEASLVNVQPGLARFEAITSQSIFVNCIEFSHCKAIDFGVFIESTLGRIAPSFIYQSDIPTTQIRYITEFLKLLIEEEDLVIVVLVTCNGKSCWPLDSFNLHSNTFTNYKILKSPFISFILQFIFKIFKS